MALANDMDIVTQDDGFDVTELAGGPVVMAGREVAELSPVRRHRWVNGPALDRVWRGPAPRELERDIALIDTSVIDPYDT